MDSAAGVTGRCYCGALRWEAGEALTVAFCHCGDCKRWTGAPLPAFAAFAEDDIALPDGVAPREFVAGVRRWACPDCGSPIAASFDYLPGQIYVPLGVLDQIDQLAPRIHCHGQSAVPWLHLDDGLPREDGSGRAALNVADHAALGTGFPVP